MARTSVAVTALKMLPTETPAFMDTPSHEQTGKQSRLAPSRIPIVSIGSWCNVARMKLTFSIALAALLAPGFHANAADAQNTLTAAEKKAGWKLLFDGKS